MMGRGRSGKRSQSGKTMIVRVPDQFGQWIDIDELRQIRVEIREVESPNQTIRIGQMSLADLLHKMR